MDCHIHQHIRNFLKKEKIFNTKENISLLIICFKIKLQFIQERLNVARVLRFLSGVLNIACPSTTNMGA
jgi:hypothetical protein